MRSLRLLAIGALALLAAGCASLKPPSDTDAQKTALRTAEIAVTTYIRVYQPAVIAYGQLPPCPLAPICKDQGVVEKLKAVDLAAVSAIRAVRPVLKGELPDAGQVAIAIRDVMIAQNAIVETGALTLERKTP